MCVYFVFSSSCVPYVASFSVLSNFDCLFGILKPFIHYNTTQILGILNVSKKKQNKLIMRRHMSFIIDKKYEPPDICLFLTMY
jgi:hypothetical protein